MVKHYRKNVQKQDSFLGKVKLVYRFVYRLGEFILVLSAIAWFVSFSSWSYVKTRDTKTEATEVKSEVKKAEATEKRDVEIPRERSVDLFDKYFGDEAGIMRAVCKSESGLDPNAINTVNKDRSVDYGICQINSIHSQKWVGKNIYDPEVNISVAKQIRDEWGNFNAWTNYKNGKYLSHLDK